MEKTELDFGGDLSVARSTGWKNKTGTPRVCVAIGVPAGVVGTIGINVSGRDLAANDGTPYPNQPATQPTGGAAYRLVLDLETPAPFIEFTWTPGDGNAGDDAYFTDDSFTANSKPLMVAA